MQTSNAKALAYIFEDEGGYAERALEGGGAVNRGVTFTSFQRWWQQTKRPGTPTFADLKKLTLAQAADIFLGPDFGARIKLDQLPAGVDYCLLDSAINNGPTGAITLLQRAVGLPVTGKMDGPTTWAATHRRPIDLINSFCDTRLRVQKTFRAYRSPTKPGGPTTYGMVWDRRVEFVRKRALQIIKES